MRPFFPLIHFLSLGANSHRVNQSPWLYPIICEGCATFRWIHCSVWTSTKRSVSIHWSNSKHLSMNKDGTDLYCPFKPAVSWTTRSSSESSLEIQIIIRSYKREREREYSWSFTDLNSQSKLGGWTCVSPKGNVMPTDQTALWAVFAEESLPSDITFPLNCLVCLHPTTEIDD